jgi:hypothetical protein
MLATTCHAPARSVRPQNRRRYHQSERCQDRVAVASDAAWDPRNTGKTVPACVSQRLKGRPWIGGTGQQADRQTIGRRLKPTGARSRPKNAPPWPSFGRRLTATTGTPWGTRLHPNRQQSWSAQAACIANVLLSPSFERWGHTSHVLFRAGAEMNGRRNPGLRRARCRVKPKGT